MQQINLPQVNHSGKGKRYSAEERSKVHRAIRESFFLGRNYDEIAAELAKQGIKTPSGAVPSYAFVNNQVQNMKTLRRRKKSTATKKKAAPVVAAPTVAAKKDETHYFIRGVLNDSFLTDKKKLDLIRTYVANY